MMFFISVALMVYMNSGNKNTQSLAQIEKIRGEYSKTDAELEEIYAEALENMDLEVPTGGDNTWTRANGQIEIQFLTGTSYTVGQANAPKIDEKEMIPLILEFFGFEQNSLQIGNFYSKINPKKKGKINKEVLNNARYWNW